jgi:hypothetical protein
MLAQMTKHWSSGRFRREWAYSLPAVGRMENRTQITSQKCLSGSLKNPPGADAWR